MAEPDQGSTNDTERASQTYTRLMAASGGGGFDAHVVACILAMADGEAAGRQGSLCETAGFDDTDELVRLFPQAGAWIEAQGVPVLVRAEDELCLIDLLFRGSVSHSPFEHMLAGLIARRAQNPNHLWQDLGLSNRGELNRLMTDHFQPLARRNRADMKWKKFFYRTLCRDADYALCTAPSCSDCSDFDTCFGEETGECLLAHTRRKADRAA